MSEAFISEIRIVSFSFAPQGWAQCDGQLLPINQNQALFSLLGTVYGGNGQTNFALPDFRARIPMHESEFHSLGERSGQETHTLTLPELGAHAHRASCSSAAGTKPTPANNFWANVTVKPYSSNEVDAAMSAATTTAAGGGQAHDNMPPTLVLNFIIALQGIFPSRT
jgi:microcystin-dependent protein